MNKTSEGHASSVRILKDVAELKLREALKNPTHYDHAGWTAATCGLVHEAADRIDELLAQRDELLAALEGLLGICEEHDKSVAGIIGRPLGWKDTYLDAARAAIAKAVS